MMRSPSSHPLDAVCSVFAALGMLLAGGLLLSMFSLIEATTARAATAAGDGQISMKPKIVSRKQWRAAAGRRGMKKHHPRFITIHHTATRQNIKRSVERKIKAQQAFSQRSEKLASGRMKPAWGDVPYHFYIGVSGRIAKGRELKYAGDTNTGYNTGGHIQIVLEGNFMIERPSSRQISSLQHLTVWLARKWNVKFRNIRGHNIHARTQCPGKNLSRQLSALQILTKRNLAGNK